MLGVLIYADGSCINNGMPSAVGGWGAILIGTGNISNLVKEASGQILPTSTQRVTNQRAEIIAVSSALRLLKKPCEAIIHTDSQYVVGIMRDGWKKKENLDLWNELLDASKGHSLKWIHIRGHRGNSYNERCDYLAQKAAREAQSVLHESAVSNVAEMPNEVLPTV